MSAEVNTKAIEELAWALGQAVPIPLRVGRSRFERVTANTLGGGSGEFKVIDMPEVGFLAGHIAAVVLRKIGKVGEASIWVITQTDWNDRFDESQLDLISPHYEVSRMAHALTVVGEWLSELKHKYIRPSAMDAEQSMLIGVENVLTDVHETLTHKFRAASNRKLHPHGPSTLVT